MINIPNDVNLIFEVFKKYKYLCFGVGGWIRDSLMGIQTFDIDLCTDATPDKLMQLFASYSPKAVYPYGIQFSFGDYMFEITTMRTESKTTNGRHPKTIQYTNRIEEDVLRRDFTINGLYYSPQTGIVDLVNGLDAIRNKELIVIGDPTTRFNEDYIRVLRLMMFQSRLGFSVSDATLNASLEIASKIDLISIQQQSTYFTKILMGDYVISTFEIFEEIFLKMIPELKDSSLKYIVSQNGVMNLYEYLSNVTHKVKKDLNLKLAALFHKIGLMNCACDGLGLSESCSNSESQLIAKKYLDKFLINKKRQKQILKVMEMHDLHLKLDDKSMLRFIFEYGQDSVTDFIEFQRCINIVLGFDDISKKQEDLYRKVIESNFPLSHKQLSLSLHELVEAGVPLIQASSCLQYAYIAYLSGQVEDDPIALKEFCMEVNDEVYSRY